MCLPTPAPQPGDDLVGPLRERLLRRFFREVTGLYESRAEAIEAVIEADGMFERDWLDDFLPPRPALEDAPPPTRPPPTGKVRGKSLDEWWQFHLGDLMRWGGEQPWGRRGDGVQGQIGEAYAESARHWPACTATDFVIPADPPRTTKDALEWLKWVLTFVSGRKDRAFGVALEINPAAVVADPPAAPGTATVIADREQMADRVRSLAAQFCEDIPGLTERLGGRDALQLLRVADQLEVAAGLAPDRCHMWCRQTIGGRSAPDIGAELSLKPNDVNQRLFQFRHAARRALLALWLPHAPAPEGRASD